MTSFMTPCRPPVRRAPIVSGRSFRVAQALAGVFVATVIAGCAQPVAAQDNWWEGITGFGTPDFSGRRASLERTPPKQDVVNDLRPNEVPWRSDEMLIAMEKAIETYHQIVNSGGWRPIPGNRMLRPGDDDDRVPFLRRRLMATGELPRNANATSHSFDHALEQAVIRYQERNGLRATGRVDQSTLAALNISADERLQQLRLNQGRIMELVQQPPEERYVLVNVPAYQLEAVERFQTVLRHRVIVGRNGRDTPTLKTNIRALNFFPHWRVPDSIARLDVFPLLVKEPEYLDKEKIRVLQGNFNGQELDPRSIDWTQADHNVIKLRQDPGPQNALGLVRIDMANEHGVYMHDTPLKPLFQQRARAFSAGCVRVQDVFELVEWLARYEPGWESPGQVQAVLDMGQPVDVKLTRPVPVYFAYITAWAEPDGRIEFRPDIYRRDGSAMFAEVYDPDAPPMPSGGLAP